MSTLRTLTRVCRDQARNALKKASGRTLTPACLGSTTFDEDDVELVRLWLRDRSKWNGQDTITQFESQFAHWNESKYAFAFMSARVALSACIHALGLQPGDEVILPGYTCVVVPNAFRYAGVTTIFSDIELDTYGLDVNHIKNKITSRTKAILLHHLYGLVCRDYEAIIDLAQSHNIQVIEDCAQSTGASYKNQKIGNLGDLAVFSSEQSKVFNTVQGGLAVTNNQQLADGIRDFYDKASYPDEDWIDRQLYTVMLNYYQCKHPGRWWLGDIFDIRYGHKRLISTTTEEEKGIRPETYGRKMPAPIAALAINQLGKIDRYNELRRETAKRWDNWCEHNGYNRPVVIDSSVPVFLRYPVIVDQRKKQDTAWAKKELEVDLGVWFVSHLHPAPGRVEGCPNADQAVAGCVNFPSLIY